MLGFRIIGLVSEENRNLTLGVALLQPGSWLIMILLLHISLIILPMLGRQSRTASLDSFGRTAAARL